MPQMSPMFWVILFSIFLSVYMFYITLIYMMKTYKPSSKTSFMKKSITLNWKW